jgi:hypothetical protein
MEAGNMPKPLPAAGACYYMGDTKLHKKIPSPDGRGLELSLSIYCTIRECHKQYTSVTARMLTKKIF